jgi:hypothetical protein
MPSPPSIIFNLSVSWALLVLIWLVQVIIYPGFHRIAADDFIDYHRWYVARISLIVTPLMLAEAVLTVMWLWVAGTPAAVISAALVLVVWLSTFLLQVPIHNRLKYGKDRILIRRLVATNWIRTVGWSLKTLIVTLASIA